VASRRRGTYWSRFFMAVGTIVVGLVVYLESQDRATHELAWNLFNGISVIAFIYSLGTGIRSTADCLSEEKRDGTLGLLFLTDLKGYDVVGGKLVATSFNAFYGLLAILPVMAIPLLMGGVTNGEFWRMALLLANTFFFSLAVGMFMSSICTSPRKAMAGTLMVMLIVSVGLPVSENLFTYINRSPNLQLVFNYLTPETAFVHMSDADYKTGAKEFWWSVGVIHGLSWLLLALASFIVPRSWQDNPAGAKLQRLREHWHRWSYGDSGERLAFRRRLLDINAFFWLAGRARLKPAHVWVALIIVACLWSWGAMEQGRDWMNVGVYAITAIVLNSMLKIWIASEAGRRLGEDRKIGALELLLSTPLSVPDIVQGQMLALRRQFLGPVVVTLLVEGVFLMAGLQSSHADSEEISIIAGFGVTMMAMLMMDALAMAVLSMWISLTAKNPNRVTGMTIRRILVLPWVLIIAVVLLGNIGTYGRQEEIFTWKLMLALYLVAGIATDLFFGLLAWWRLHAEFRQMAAQRFSPLPPFWVRLLGNREQPETATPPPATAS
jgi:ABC-type Na+ efflux pump permease subunit